MSLKAETFYAIQCEYPECGELAEGYEYTYTSEPYADADGHQDMGWCISEKVGDYCPEHAETADCEPDEHGECVRCGETCEEGSWCARPFPTTPEGQLQVMLKRIAEQVHRAGEGLLFGVDRKLGTQRVGGPGTLRGRTDQALNDIHRRACLAICPDLTTRQIAMMQKAAA
jgi:hypothetical protein